MSDKTFSPTTQQKENGPLTADFQQRIRRMKERYNLTWWDLAGLARPPISGGYLGNIARYDGLNVTTSRADGLREIVEFLERYDPGTPEAEGFLASRGSNQVQGKRGDASPARTSEFNISISIEDAVRALRAAGFEVTLTAR